jgi:hypothetical protein
MIVKLKVNLKIGNSGIITAGTVYNDADSPFPDFIMNNMDNLNIIHKETITPIKKENALIKEKKEVKATVLIRKKK